MADSVNEAELGRSKQSETPREHLLHLLTVGWDPEAPLIKKYVAENGLHSVLREWLKSENELERLHS